MNQQSPNILNINALKKVSIQIDPTTKRKYIIQHGKKIEVVTKSQISGRSVPISTLRKDAVAKAIMESCSDIVTTNTLEDEIKPNIIIKKKTNPSSTTTNVKDITIKSSSTNNNGKLPEKVKYQVMNLNMRKISIGTMTNTLHTVERGCQTSKDEINEGCHISTQTDFNDFDELVNFIVGDVNVEEQKPIVQPKCAVSHQDIVKYQFYNDINKALVFDRAGNLPIHESVLQNDEATVRRNCVILHAIQRSVNITNRRNYSPLHLAIIHNAKLEIVQTLIKFAADIEQPDAEGNTSLHLAIDFGRSEMLPDLVKNGLKSGMCIDSFNHDGFTPLIMACMNQSIVDAKLLLDNGADPNIRDWKSGRTALFHATELANEALVELIMKYRADTKIRNFFGTSAHDAMFEIEDMPNRIKVAILGRDPNKPQSKKREMSEKGHVEPVAVKKAKMQTTPVLMKI